MKTITLVLLVALTTPVFSQAPSPVPIQAEAPLNASSAPALSSITNAPPAPTTETYLNQIRSRYRLPYPTPAGSVVRRGGQDLIAAVENASRENLPLDVIQNVGNARARFLQDTQDARKKLQQLFDSPFISADASRIPPLREQKAKALLDLEVKEAKVIAIQIRSDDLTSKIKQEIDHDEILKALIKLEAARREQLNEIQTRITNGTEQRAMLSAAQADLAAAGIDIARRRADIAASAFGGALDTLNKLLVETSLTVEELKATIKALDTRIAGIEKALSTNQQISKLNTQLNALRHLQEIEQNLQPPPPRP